MKAPRFLSRPEDALQERIVRFLTLRGWHVEETHGNAYQKGLPDLFAWNAKLGLFRWIDVKIESNYRYTKHQCIKWTEWESKDLGVWIMVGDTEQEYSKLFEPPNFRLYWKPHYDKYLIPIEQIVVDIREDRTPVKGNREELLDKFLGC